MKIIVSSIIGGIHAKTVLLNRIQKEKKRHEDPEWMEMIQTQVYPNHSDVDWQEYVDWCEKGMGDEWFLEEEQESDSESLSESNNLVDKLLTEIAENTRLKDLYEERLQDIAAPNIRLQFRRKIEEFDYRIKTASKAYNKWKKTEQSDCKTSTII